MSKQDKLTRRQFLKGAAVASAAAAASGMLDLTPAAAQGAIPTKWDYEADVVVIGSGSTGMPAALRSRELGATVIVVEGNFDVGGRAITAGDAHTIGGGTKIQAKNNVQDSPDQFFQDLCDWTVAGQDGYPDYRYNNFELMRAVANVGPEIFDWMEANGCVWDYESLFAQAGKGGGWGVSVPRAQALKDPDAALAKNPHFAPGNGHRIIRPLEKAARAKGVKFMLNRHADKIFREGQFSGRVLGISASYTPRILPGTEKRLESFYKDGNIDETRPTVTIKANKGIIIATSGANGNVAFRRTYDYRNTEEVQVSVSPWLGWDRAQDGAMIIEAMNLGASLGCVTQMMEHGGYLRKRTIVGARDVYKNWPEDSPVYPFAGSTGALNISDAQRVNCINVNQVGKRFYNETSEGYNYPRTGPTLIGICSQKPYVPMNWRNLQAVKANYDTTAYAWTNAARAMNEGSKAPDYAPGPVWLIFDEAERARRKWNVEPPATDPKYFFKASTLAELASKISQNPFTKVPMPAANLEATVKRYNELVAGGKDLDFDKEGMQYKVETPPFYAGWCTPVLHDFYGALRVNADSQVIDRWGKPIPGLYAGGEAASGWEEHGHGKCITGGYLAARHVVAQKPAV